jgi:hypothetical protein
VEIVASDCGICQLFDGPTLYRDDLVPRYATMPRDAKGWSVWDLQRVVAANEIPIDRADIERISEAYRRALAASARP